MFANKNNKKTGFTLVETLIAIFIFTLSIVALFALIGDSLFSAQYAKYDITAQYLAGEALDYIRNDRDTIVFQQNTKGNTSISADWNGFLQKYGSGGNLCFGTNGCTVDVVNDSIQQCFPSCSKTKLYTGGIVPYYGTTGAGAYSDTPYTRVIKMYQNSNNSDSILVVVSVNWNIGRSSNTKTYSEVLYNWGQ